MTIGDKLHFSTFQRSKLFEAARLDSGRLHGALKLKLTDTATGDIAEGDAPFVFHAAADVAALKPGAILRVAPPPFANDAETTKLVHVDFSEPDLPWRYTPELNGDRISPWLVLLVGKAGELDVEGDLVKMVSPAVLKAHSLAESHLWAHVQDGISRLLSPSPLEKLTDYTAVLVPAYQEDGSPMWAGGALGAGVELRALHSWRFRTGEEGDFETLAGALRMRRAGDLGKADLRYAREVTGIDVTLEMRGAITSLQLPPDEAANAALARGDLDLLNDGIEDIGEPKRSILGLPPYGRPWLPNPDDAVWGKTLNDDPRFRGIAGLGAWLGIEAQTELMDAAVRQAGALDDAAQRIRSLAFGLLAARRLWQRRLPDDGRLRLAVFGPAMGRMLAAGGGTVLGRITSGRSPIPPALFSSAAARLLRGGTARTRHAAGVAGRAAALDAANRVPAAPGKAAGGLPHADRVLESLGLTPLEKLLGMKDIPPELYERLREIAEKFAGQRNDAEIRFELMRVLEEHDIRCRERILSALESMEQGGMAVLEADVVVEVVRRFCYSRGLPFERGKIDGDFLVESAPAAPADRFRPVDLGKLAEAVGGSIDPTAALPPGWRRVAATIEGLDLSGLAPPELPLGLDFPTWQLLNRYESDWLLPGRSAIEKDSIVALQTNPPFIDAFMVGINTQFMSEMRWRNLPVSRTFTPLRMFWGYVNYATGKREADIEPLAEWAKRPAADIGDLSHQTVKPGDTEGKQDLVIAFRTDLFRRYPSTLVYLVKKPPDGTPAEQVDQLLMKPPVLEHTPEARGDRQYLGPIFMAGLEPDLHIFMFDVKPSLLDQYWLVLDEPPAELRFRYAPNDLSENSAEFARGHIDKPTRVAIDGGYLEKQAVNP